MTDKKLTDEEIIKAIGNLFKNTDGKYEITIQKGYPEMEIREITFRQACDFVAEHHYYSPTEGGIGCNFCLGFYDNDKLVGVAMICGRPVGIKPDKEFTCEVNRLCTDGTYHGWAMFYATCYQVVKQNGYKKLIIYI